MLIFSPGSWRLTSWRFSDWGPFFLGPYPSYAIVSRDLDVDPISAAEFGFNKEALENGLDIKKLLSGITGVLTVFSSLVLPNICVRRFRPKWDGWKTQHRLAKRLPETVQTRSSEMVRQRTRTARAEKNRNQSTGCLRVQLFSPSSISFEVKSRAHTYVHTADARYPPTCR